jgi:integrase/recombinase XerD
MPTSDQLPTIASARASRLLTADEFHRLADVRPEVEWFANLTNAHTRRAYENAVKDFMRFAGIARPEEFRTVTQAHVIAWRDDLRTRVTRRGEAWSDPSIRHRLSALAALFEYLCDRNAVTHNPVKGVARPKSESGEGKTPVLGDHQARKLLDAPDGNHLKDLRQGRLSEADESIRSKRDRAILSTLLFHALRREELCKLKVKDFRHTRKAVPHLRVSRKGGKWRYLLLHPGTHALIHEYIEAAGHAEDVSGALFRPIRNNATGELDKAITPDGVTNLCAPSRLLLASRLEPMRCGRPWRPMRSITRPISLRCKSGLDTRILRRRGSMITAARDRRTVRRSR